MNKAEAFFLEKVLAEGGWEKACDPKNADLVILNTCAVRESAERRVWGRLGEHAALKRRKGFILTVMGCMAQRLQGEIQNKIPEVDYVIGTFEKIPYIQSLKTDFPYYSESNNSDQRLFPSRYGFTSCISSFIPIMHGCNNFCSYCIVPYVRGPEVSRRPNEIIEEIIKKVKNGTREIVLLGQNVNSYYSSMTEKTIFFPDLLSLIHEKLTKPVWLRFLTSHPKDFSQQLVDRIKEHPEICNHIHLPIQSGSDKILKLMNRKYTRSTYLKLVDSIRENIPNVTLSTDLLVGFPQENEKDFKDTLDIVKKVEYNDAFTYKYNPREGTKAYNYGDEVSEEVKSSRLQQLIDFQQPIGRKKRKKEIGRIVPVLVENISKKNYNELIGRTDNNNMVVFPGKHDMIGKFVYIRIISIVGNTLRGEVTL